MSNMKLLQVTSFFKPSWETGGPARVAYEISKKLIKQGHEVTVYTTDGFKSRLDIEKNKPLNIDGIKTYYFRNLSSYLTREMVLPIPYYLSMVARKELKNFDVIHIHEYRSVLAIVVHYYAKKYGVPYVLQAHGSLVTYFQKGMLKRVFDRLWGYRILRDVSKVIALNKTEAGQYKMMGVDEDKIEIVSNGIDLSEFESLPPRGEFRKKYLIGDDEKVVLYVGRLHKTKGIDLLIKAFAGVSKELNNTKLIIVGPDDGHLRALKELIKELAIEEKVVFTGLLYERDKLQAYVDADIFVTPSFYGFPVTFMEACACGVPIVTTTKGDRLDWMDGQVGLVVPYDKNQLQDAIVKFLSDNGLRRRFGEKGKMLVRERFNWTKIVKQLEHIYSNITHSS